MNSNLNNNLTIDAVITWVDSNDQNWQRKINPFLKKKVDWSNKNETVRYQSIDEISYCIRSIIKFAPFIRNIFVVTDNQKPESFESLKLLAQKNGILLRIVDHTELFKGFEEYLPSFNGRSITPLFYQIEGLAEHYLYLNDDFILMKKTKITDFFKNGYPVLRGKWAMFYEDRILRKIYLKVFGFLKLKPRVVQAGYKKAQQKSASLAGFKKYFKLHHTPMAIRKSTLVNFFNENPEILENNVKHRFRHESQFVISSLSSHLEIKNKTCFMQDDLQLTYFQSYNYFFKIQLKLWWFNVNPKKLFTCFQSLEMTNKKTFEYIIKWMNERLSM